MAHEASGDLRGAGHQAESLLRAARIEDLIKGEGTSFVAVGAAHYAGPDGIIALLARDGYVVQKL